MVLVEVLLLLILFSLDCCLAETARPRKNSVRLIDWPSPRKSLVKGERFVRV